ncbi:MAG: prephenate dehydrogenase/arogenate dehydrogenase family protein [Spirochaetes bacterium]|nr:prephenate dehydrogenase/arogenate dehydrogenase family protein [Spirochaetota bacterium]MBU1080293.1 prephenate dehydrogenase/arogenate dehydrogenase family protein [Spirochaetota bacterium]
MRIAILGAGKMGAWLASALSGSHEVLAYDTDEARLVAVAGAPDGARDESPAGQGAGILASSRLADLGPFAPDMLVNCVPLGLTEEAFDAALPFLPASCSLSDIASVKTGLAGYYAAAGRPFVSSHPMFGPTYADESNLSEQSAVLIEESCAEGKAFWRAFYEGLGITVYEDGFDGHDRTVAYSLATPFASTMVFAACMKRLDAPGTNFKKHLEIARGLLAEDDRLLAEIMFNPYTIRRIELINSQLSYLTHIIKDRDHEEMAKFLGKLRDNLGEARFD